jgi:hypothetical protein
MYEWEYRRKDRPKFRAAMVQRDRMLRSLKTAYVNSLLEGSGTGRSSVATTVPTVGTGDRTASAVDVLDTDTLDRSPPTPP